MLGGVNTEPPDTKTAEVSEISTDGLLDIAAFSAEIWQTHEVTILYIVLICEVLEEKRKSFCEELESCVDVGLMENKMS